MSRTGALAGVACLTALALVHCGDDDSPSPGTVDAALDDGEDAADTPADAATAPGALDLLFVLDNSILMVDKRLPLYASIPRLFEGLKFADIHVGVVSTSLGNGGDLCDRTRRPSFDTRARLLNRDDAGAIVSGAEGGFLSFGPGGSVPDLATLAQRTEALLRAVPSFGCGFESPLEAAYRFAAEPDPPLEIRAGADGLGELVGVDYELLAQRRAFFRESSLVAIVIVTDEDDASLDARSVGGLGYGFGSATFPDSKVTRGADGTGGTTAPRGTAACDTTPESADCTSCGLARVCDPSASACQKLRSDVACTTAPSGGPTGEGYAGHIAPDGDNLNIRFFDMKRRFGVDPRYPVERYVAAFTGRKLPNRASEHVEAQTTGRREIGPYSQAETCANPLFSGDLPSKEGDELCNLGPGKRTPADVVIALLAGAVPALVEGTPDWTGLLGKDPERGDRSGIDPHMLLSVEPRPQLTGADLPIGDNGSDPVHGREWNTMKRNFQFACSFPLDVPRDCTKPGPECACLDTTVTWPLCGWEGNQWQLRGYALPGVRELEVMRGLGDRGLLVGSVCAVALEGPPYARFFDAVRTKLATR
ncbi:MAG: hypothetical protein KIT84_13805 [Labilithrix sp.]|nr:hypothetical protein [Labilithrix sp.]